MSFDYISKGAPKNPAPVSPSLAVDITNGVLYVNSGGSWLASEQTLASGAIVGLTTTVNTAVIPVKTAGVSLTAQSAAIAATNLLPATAPAGVYHLDAYAKVTTVDGTSSTLGGATGLVIAYKDIDTVAQSKTFAFSTTAGAIATNSAGNTTTTTLGGDMIINTDGATAVTYAFGYTSNTPGQMIYELYIRAVFLG